MSEIFMVSIPPSDVRFNSLEEMVDWYKEHPERLCVVKNVEILEVKNED